MVSLLAVPVRVSAQGLPTMVDAKAAPAVRDTINIIAVVELIYLALPCIMPLCTLELEFVSVARRVKSWRSTRT